MSLSPRIRRQLFLRRAQARWHAPQRGRRRRLLMEMLEPRTLLAAVTPLPVEGFVSGIDDAGNRVVLLSTHDNDGANADQNEELFLFDRVTSAVIQITNTTGAGVNGRGHLSPDGNFVVFSSQGDLTGGNADGNAELFRFDVAAGTLTQLTQTTTGANLFPVVNADGSSVAFESDANLVGSNNPEGNVELFLLSVGGVNSLTQVTQTTSGNNTNAAINADATRIAFTSDADLPGASNADGNVEVFLYDDGSGQFLQITDTAADRENSRPSIDASGDRVVMTSTADLTGSNMDGNREVFLATIAGSSVMLRAITDTAAQTFQAIGHPAISAEGSRISLYSYTSNRELRVSTVDVATNAESILDTGPSVPASFFLQLINRDGQHRDALRAPINRTGEFASYTAADASGQRAAFIANEANQTFVVNSTGDSGDASPGDGLCHTGNLNAEGADECTLRAAIQETNALPNLDNKPDQVLFHIPGAGPHTIQPNSALPAIADPVVIDALTQPGAIPNSNPFPQAFDGTLMIELDGSNAGQFADGLTITGGNSLIRGLVVGRFGGEGISISNAGGNAIEGNYIGTDVNAMLARGNTAAGVGIFGSTGNRIGGVAPLQRNLISGNDPSMAPGVSIFGSGTGSANEIMGNFFGTDATGLAALPNFAGVSDLSSLDLIIGGSDATAGNLISGNQGPGVFLSSSSPANRQIRNNFIGTDSTGAAALGNQQAGINLSVDGASITENVIAFNQGAGILVGTSSTGNTIQRNSIFNNIGLGLDLAITGFTANDPPDDDDTGANNLQNFPEIESVSLNGTVSITYSVPSIAPHSAFPLDIEFYLADADGQEGRTLIGADTYQATDGNKTSAFSPLAPVHAGAIIVSTATDASGNTSEFSTGTQVVVPGGLFDFGDAPDPLITTDGEYPTRLANNGARHTITVGGPFLGNAPPDAEADAQQNEQSIAIVNAGFDDLHVSSTDATPLALNPGEFTTGLGSTDVRTLSTIVGQAFVPGWSNGSGNAGTRGISHPDGLFNPTLDATDYALFAQGPFGVAEQVLSVAAEPNTIYTLTVDVGDQVFLNLDPNRFVGLLVDGAELAGGVTEFTPPADGAFTTLTRTYRTGSNVPDGNLAIRLGSISGSFQGQVYYNNVSLTARSTLADGDDAHGTDDEDGLLSLRGLNAGAGDLLRDDPFTATVQVNGSGLLNAFADWNRDGDWDDDGEQIASDIVFDTSTGSNIVQIAGTTHADAVPGPSYLRLRVDSSGGLGPRGLANDGEVEDHLFQIVNCALVVSHTGDSGSGSLRDALACSNSLDGRQTIEFNIPADDPGHLYYQDDGVEGQVTLASIATTTASDDGDIADLDPDWPHSWFSIVPQSLLPDTTDPIVIDGYSQPGATVNTNPVGQGLNTVLRIEINGAEAAEDDQIVLGGLLTLTGGESVVRGLVLNRGPGPNIVFQGDAPHNNLVEGNFIGPDVSGTLSFDPATLPNVNNGRGFSGVRMSGSNGNLVGGTTAGARNLISGNGRSAVNAGIFLTPLSQQNRIEGNLIGTDRTGEAALSNLFRGVVGGHGTVIGGADANARNVIADTVEPGIEGVIENNLVGTDISGAVGLGTTAGVSIPSFVQNTRTLHNTIAFGGGVSVEEGDDGHLISENAIFSNPGLGIAIENNVQAAPVLTSVTDIGTGTRVVGTLSSAPDSDYRLEFFSIDRREEEAPQFGEGKTLLGSFDISTDGNGVFDFSFDLPTLTAAEPYVTATATDITDDGTGPRNNTSPFSLLEPLGGCRFTVTSTSDSGPGTLREAIICANLTAGPQTIDFNIPADDPGHFYYQDDGVAGEVTFENTTVTIESDDSNILDIDPDWPHSWFSILPLSQLPTITNTVTIDGYSQSGSSSNTLEFPQALDTVLKIELDGSRVRSSGLLFRAAGGNVLRGLAVNRFGGSGVEFDTLGGNNAIAGSFIGTDVSGLLGVGNEGDGLLFDRDPDSSIGGDLAEQRMLVAANGLDGVKMIGAPIAGIAGLNLGTNRTNSSPLPNGRFGISINPTETPTPQSFSHDSFDAARCPNCTIDPDYHKITMFLPFPFPTFFEFDLSDSGDNASVYIWKTVIILISTLSGTPSEASRQGDSFLSDRTSGRLSSDATAALPIVTAIDLNGDGTTNNDSLDTDSGPNGLQNFPVLTSATSSDTTTIVGTLNSQPHTSFRIELYSSSYNTTVIRAGENSLGTIDVTTDLNGDASFQFDTPESVPVGHFVTSLATRMELIEGVLLPIETSEFSDGLAIPGSFDFGDAPDTYGTTHSSPFALFGGARHTPTGVTLGAARDAEADAADPLDGTGDDVSTENDEDGVDFGVGMGVLPVGQRVPVDVAIQTSAGDARLYAWIDFNGDGDFLDEGELIANGTGSFANLGNGNVMLNVDVPDAGFAGTSYARFRVSTDENLDFDGQASDGEVEDYRIAIVNASSFDFGDAPSAAQSGFASDYPTNLPDGARHGGSGLFLGSAVDAEEDGQPTAQANGDGADEDGVAFVASLVAMAGSETKSSVLVTASAPGKLDAWIDFNRDGDWLDEGEQLFAQSVDLVVGANIVSFTVPAGASVGETYARFRLSSAGALGPDGAAENGEVEDYRLAILDGDEGANGIVDLIVGDVEVLADGDDIVVRHDGIELFRALGGALASGTFLGTDGDDTVSLGNLESVLTAAIPLIYDGGAGFDTFVLANSNQTLDLTDTTLNQLANLEAIDIVGNSPNTLILDAQSVIAATDAGNRLLVQHDDDDSVDYQGAWSVQPPRFIDAHYAHVLRSGGAEVLVVNARAWRNPLNPLDSNRDGEISPVDVLVNINLLNDFSTHRLPTPALDALPEFYHDSNGDDFISPVDPLQRINFLNDPSDDPEGELAAGSSAELIRSPNVRIPLAANSATGSPPTVLARGSVSTHHVEPRAELWRRDASRLARRSSATARGRDQLPSTRAAWEELLHMLAEDRTDVLRRHVPGRGDGLP